MVRCVICDMCEAVIENETQVREIVCTRPGVNYDTCGCTYSSSSNYQKANEIVWKHEVCISCADKILSSIESNSEE